MDPAFLPSRQPRSSRSYATSRPRSWRPRPRTRTRSRGTKRATQSARREPRTGRDSRRVFAKAERRAHSLRNRAKRRIQRVFGRYNVYERSVDDQNSAQLQRALVAATADLAPTALSLFQRAQERHVPLDVLRATQLRRLVRIALKEGKIETLVQILRECASRSANTIGVDHIVTTPPILLKRMTIPAAIAADPRRTVEAKMQALDMVLREFGTSFDLNRELRAGGNLMLHSFITFRIGDPKWYAFLCQHHVHINSSQMPHGKTLLDYVEQAQKDPSWVDVSLGVLVSTLRQHGARHSAELAQ